MSDTCINPEYEGRILANAVYLGCVDRFRTGERCDRHTATGRYRILRYWRDPSDRTGMLAEEIVCATCGDIVDWWTSSPFGIACGGYARLREQSARYITRNPVKARNYVIEHRWGCELWVCHRALDGREVSRWQPFPNYRQKTRDDEDDPPCIVHVVSHWQMPVRTGLRAAPKAGAA